MIDLRKLQKDVYHFLSQLRARSNFYTIINDFLKLIEWLLRSRAKVIF